MKFSSRSGSFEGQIPHIFHNNYLDLIKCCEAFVKVKCQDHFKVKWLKLFLIANYAITPCGEVITKVRVILRSNTKVKVISRSNTHISSNNYLRLIKC